MGRSSGNKGDNSYYNNVTPSYDAVIYQWGANAYAEDRQGNVIFRPTAITACSGVFTAVITYLKGIGGGKCYIYPGTYEIQSISIDSASDITLEGVYGETILKADAQAISISIGAQGTTTRANSNICIRNIVFDGGAPTISNSVGLEINGLDGGVFENLIFQNHQQRAFRMTVWGTTQISSRRVTCKNFRFINDCTVFGGVEDSLFDNFHFSGTLAGTTMNTVVDLSFEEQGPAGLVENCTFRKFVSDNVVSGGGLNHVVAGFQYVRNVLCDDWNIDSTTSKVQGIVRATNPADRINGKLTFSNCVVTNVNLGFNIGNCTIIDTHIKGCVNYGILPMAGNVYLERVRIEDTNTASHATTFDKGCLYVDTITTPVICRECYLGDTGATTPQGLYINNSTAFDIQGSNFAGPWAVQNAVGAGTNTGSIIRNNTGYVSENAGTNNIANGATSRTIAHGLSYTPFSYEITITLLENPTNTPGAIWVDGIDGTNFVVNCENDPGASNLDFAWSVRRMALA